ncbi:MAG: efflux RND transporter periplasmic adaptor subunit [Desulfocucumaceae bacterium]
MKLARFVPAVLITALFFIQGCAGKDAGVTVVTERARISMPVSSDYITGKTEAVDTVTIIPKVAGKVSQVAVDVGSRVKAGQVLMKIDMSDIEATRDQYRAAVDDAESGIKKARIDLDTARDNYERASALFKSGALSKSDFDNKYAAPYELARLQAEETAPNKLAQSRAALQSVEANYANSVITSPIDGEITARQINPGETCSTSKPVILIANMSGMVVVSYVDDKKINSLKVGQQVSVKMESVDRLLQAEVKSISYTIDATAKGYQVKFRITGGDESVKPGMFARVYADGGSDKQFVFPKTALAGSGESQSVFVFSAGKVARVPVQVEKISDSYVVVKSGITEGQDVVVYSSTRLEDGMAVKVR